MTIRMTGMAAFLALGMSFAAASAQSLTVGSKNFVEQFVVGEMYAAALEGAGFKVSRQINLGSTLLVHDALRKGAIDLYPEYTGTGLSVILKAPRESDPQKVYAIVKAQYEKDFGLTWLAPTRVNNGNVMIVLRETAEARNLRTLSDLAKVADKMSLGAGPDFGTRPDGLAGLKDAYGIAFAEYRPFPAMRLRYKALLNREVDVVTAFATDGNLGDDRFVILGDDRNFFPPYHLAPVMRGQTAAAHPTAVEALEKVGALLDNPTIQALNRQVAVDEKEPRAVALEFLKTKGMLK